MHRVDEYMPNLSADNIVSESTMPYLHLDLAQICPPETKRELATRLCHLYADVMHTRLRRPNVGIAELGEDDLFHLCKNGLESITMTLVEIRRGRSLDLRLELRRGIVDICAEVLGVPRRTVLVEFTVHSGGEMLRDGDWAGDWTAAEASAQSGYVCRYNVNQLKRTGQRRAYGCVGEQRGGPRCQMPASISAYAN
jgi:phenylpyruvate tautomerase PptA (4-oxalocrotonate tautomerase family)